MTTIKKNNNSKLKFCQDKGNQRGLVICGINVQTSIVKSHYTSNNCIWNCCVLMTDISKCKLVVTEEKNSN